MAEAGLNHQFVKRPELNQLYIEHPDNADLQAYAKQLEARREAGVSTVPSLMGVDRRTNPFLRADDPELAATFTSLDDEGLVNASLLLGGVHCAASLRKVAIAGVCRSKARSKATHSEVCSSASMGNTPATQGCW